MKFSISPFCFYCLKRESYPSSHPTSPLFNFNSIYDQFIDNRKSTALTEFRNDIQDMYCKLGQTVLITFQLMNNIGDAAKSIKILNPKKLVVTPLINPNISTTYDESKGIVQLRVIIFIL